ncbi:hypothetical protein GCM10027445_35560 [Amycolatopsis endophytica]|uniref:Cobalamin-dependent methionine synthase I n=1 Tax=Amycolatopsis endophytica TaxID=860233 RepID=A0A853BBI2_9PSEU|nr:cobalamin-dependent methionine synthase I [Amycolatopsis endophytica]
MTGTALQARGASAAGPGRVLQGGERERTGRTGRGDQAARTTDARTIPQPPEARIPARSDVATDVPVPVPPFWGTRVITGVPVAEYVTLLDERATYFGQWGLRGARRDQVVETEGRARLRYWLDRLAAGGILRHAAVVYGYLPVVAEGDDLVVLTGVHADAPERARFSFPRQARDRFLCLADFYRPRETGEVDVLPLTLVTLGTPIADYADDLFAGDAYRDYLEVHGLGVQLTEALAEHWHRRVRRELHFTSGHAVADDRRGARFPLGYSACPNLADRATVVELLGAERIGVKVTADCELTPEPSADALICHHPEAAHFTI